MDNITGIKHKKSQEPANDQNYRDDVQDWTHDFIVYTTVIAILIPNNLTNGLFQIINKIISIFNTDT